ncbi:MAG TPA: DUF3179 domain-containing protein [Actinomycetota bacterium]|jgi:hypothetical protein|nr:DUF3179 domain-containing protein [Actinomycetota bacterium]
MARRLIYAAVVLALSGGLASLAIWNSMRPAGPARAAPAGTKPADLVPDSALVDVLSPDSIPSIDDPKFVAPAEASRWLADREPVVSLDLGGQDRAYPAQILTWHEIVNDVVGREPVAVTYCPLCNSAVAFSRDVDGRTLEFGVSGKLYKSALVMFDRQTDSLWLHFEGRAIQGPLTGTQLEVIPVQLLSFGEWRREHPTGLVLSRDTGYVRPYGENPYESYDSKEGPYASFFRGPISPKLPAMARVVGVASGNTAVAYAYEQLGAGRPAGVAHDTVSGRDIVVLWSKGTASALDQRLISNGRDVGASGVFVPVAEGRRLTFEVRGGAFVDRETGSTWTVSGRAVAGRLAGEQLQPVPHLDTFWFAWWGHHPDTRIFGA